ncbi:MAG: HDOD domain-containing protein [Marinobacterium sp.]|nr:HDOD domain-containing protein [Marinobacterium sp.]
MSVTEIARSFVIPVRPDVQQQLSRLIQQPEPSLRAVCALIRRDVSLYANIMALVRMGHADGHHPVISLEQAVRQLGRRRLCLLLKAAACDQQNDTAGLEHFWDEACEVATLCAGLNRYLPCVSAEEAFLLGMMHACAVPLMVRYDGDYQRFYDEACLLDLTDQQQLEQWQYHHDRFFISSQLARCWRVPGLLCDVIAAQPHYIHVLKSEWHGPRLCRLLCLLLLAVEFSLKFETLWGRADEYQPVVRMEQVLRYLGLTCDELEWLEQQLFGHLSVDDHGMVPGSA